MTNPFSFRGSIGRGKYVFTCAATYVIAILFVAYGFVPLLESYPMTKGIMFVFIILSQWIVTAASVKRLHDLGKPGSYLFALDKGKYSAFLPYILIFKEGSKNKFKDI
ncbi:MAG TPA: DUF805 domain-containing protein [Ignavibacteriales bacterium]|nr:DUF805 domain-containing protein [Ignavibacteriales bacterium]